MLPFSSKSSGGSSGPFAGIEQAMKSGGPMSVMRSFYNIPAPGMPQQAAQAPQNQMSRDQIHAMLMQIPAYAAHVQKNPGFMTSFGQPAAPQVAQPMPPQMPPAMPQPAAPQPAAPSMAGIAQPGLMQMLMGKFGGQPRVQGLLG